MDISNIEPLKGWLADMDAIDPIRPQQPGEAQTGERLTFRRTSAATTTNQLSYCTNCGAMMGAHLGVFAFCPEWALAERWGK